MKCCCSTRTRDDEHQITIDSVTASNKPPSPVSGPCVEIHDSEPVPELTQPSVVALATVTKIVPLINASNEFKKENQDMLKATANAYANVVGMDDLNRKGMEVLLTQDKASFIKHVFTAVDENGKARTLSYGEMRSLYG